MSLIDVLDLPQLYTKPSADVLLHTLTLLTVAPPSWDPKDANHTKGNHQAPPTTCGHTVRVDPQGVTRYLTSIVSSSLKWIEDEDAKEQIWTQASARLSERSGRTAMSAMSRQFQIPSLLGSFELSIHEPALTGDDLGLKTWAASYLLAKRLLTFDIISTNTKRSLNVLELGSGTGLVGLAIAGLGADVVLTDLPSICPNLARNAQHNSKVVGLNGGSIRTAMLDWTQPTVCTPLSSGTTEGIVESLPTKFSLVIAADCLYSPDHPHLLVDTIAVWLSRDENARVIIETPYREAYLSEIDMFRERMENIGLRLLEEGEEGGYDDWGRSEAYDHEEDSAHVTCWWSYWGRLGTT